MEATPMTRKLAKVFNCPSEFTLEVLGGKWKTVILCFLKQRPCRYRELRKLVPKLSDKMLSERLADLTDAGLVARRALPGRMGKEVYVLTARGRSLGGLLHDLYAWGKEHAATFGVEVGEPFKTYD
jgi:DNA-binding HxlR family transcriptional regulator